MAIIDYAQNEWYTQVSNMIIAVDDVISKIVIIDALRIIVLDILY